MVAQLKMLALVGAALAAFALSIATAENRPVVAQQPAPGAQSARCSRTEEFRHVKGQGPSCRLPNGHWKVRLRNGRTVTTHGADGPAVALETSAPLAGASSHVCVPETDYHGILIYAFPADYPDDDYAAMAVNLRSYFQEAQNILYAEAQEFGVSAAYKMACNPDGQLKVMRAHLPTLAASADFGTIVSDLQALGYSSPYTHYWVWYAGNPYNGICGHGTINGGDTPGADNGNNFGPNYGLSYNCNVMMHENGHNLGAVQVSSPNTSGAWHCNDGQDVMCYADGGPSSVPSMPCGDRVHFDCNHDDYFNPAPAPGSYLDMHWNIGACYVHFIYRSGCPYSTPAQSPTASQTSSPTPTRSLTPVPSRTATPGVSSGLYVLDGAALGTPGTLSRTAGGGATSDTIPSANNATYDGTPHDPLVYEARGLSGRYTGGQTGFSLYVNAGPTVGLAVQARVSYDLTGDGTWERVETYQLFATDPDGASWEAYGAGQGVQSASGALGALSNGRVRLEVWSVMRVGTLELRTSATAASGAQSRLVLPFAF